MIYLSLSIIIYLHQSNNRFYCVSSSYAPIYLPRGGALPSGSTANKHRKPGVNDANFFAKTVWRQWAGGKVVRLSSSTLGTCSNTYIYIALQPARIQLVYSRLYSECIGSFNCTALWRSQSSFHGNAQHCNTVGLWEFSKAGFFHFPSSIDKHSTNLFQNLSDRSAPLDSLWKLVAGSQHRWSEPQTPSVDSCRLIGSLAFHHTLHQWTLS